MSSRRDVTFTPKMLNNLWLRTFPTAEVTRLEDAGHFPHRDHPDAFVDLLTGFMDSTVPATYSRARGRRLLKNGGPDHLSSVDAASELA